MPQVFTSSPVEIKSARWPHEILLINLVFNHIFVFVAMLSVSKSFPMGMLLTPVLSFSMIGYILVKQQKIEASDASFFLKGHWKIAAKRNRWLMYLLIFSCSTVGGGFLLSKAFVWSKTATIMMWAVVGGIGFLPFMVVLLVLVTLGSDSMNIARDGRLPDNFLAKHPSPEAGNH